MLRVATVLSAREWESRLVAAARETALIRLVLRAFVPDEVASNASSIDVVVAGSETPWVTPTRVAAWRRLGLKVVGLHPRPDRPAAERLRAGGADVVLADDLDSEAIMREIRLLDAAPPTTAGGVRRIIAVTGVHGAPGVSEVALGLAWNRSGEGTTLLLDADLAAPSLAVRLGLPPRPDLADVVDRTLGTTDPVTDDLLRIGSLVVVPGTLRGAGSTIQPEMAVDVAVGLATAHDVVIDAGRWPQSQPFVQVADGAVVVTGSSPVSIVRLARLVQEWVGPRPDLVVNGVPIGRRADVLSAVRRWSGMEPAAVIPRRRRLTMTAASGGEPDRSLRRRLLGVGGDDGE
jgi:Mrp family chromosome partitioning ATPase